LTTAKNKYSKTNKKPGKTKAFFVCLLIASFLWLVHSLNTVYTYTFKIPVEFKNIPINKRPLMEMPNFITIEAKASGLKLAMILSNKYQKPYEVDFNKLQSVNKNQNYVLSNSQLNLNKRFRFDVQIKSISPDTLYFTEKTGFQKIVPVKVPLHIKCKEGYAYKKPSVTPAFLTIWGDTTYLEKVDTLYTQTLTLSNLSQNVLTTLQLIKPSSELHTAVNAVSLSVEVSKLIQQSVTIPITNQRDYPNQQVRLFPSKATIRFTALQNTFNPEDTLAFKAVINSDKVNKLSNKCPVILSSVPGNVTVLEITPKEVELLILKK
jgi:YbbR-like protein